MQGSLGHRLGCGACVQVFQCVPAWYRLGYNPGIGRIGAGLKVRIQDSGLHGIKRHHQSPLLIDKLTLDPAGLTAAPYLPCAPARQALVTNALAQSLRPRWDALSQPLPDQPSQTSGHDPGLRTEQASKGTRAMPSLKPVPLKACGGLQGCWTPTYLRQSLNHSIQQGTHACGHLQ